MLRSGGHYVCLTYGDPGSRLALLQAAGLEWDGPVGLHKVGRCRLTLVESRDESA